MQENDIPQINPQSILDPPQIKLNTAAEEGAGNMVESNPRKMIKPIKFGGRGFKLNFAMSPKKKKIFLGVGGFLLLIVIFLVVFGLIPALNIYNKGKTLADSAKKVQAAVDSQDINVVESQLQSFKGDLKDFDSAFMRLSWTKVLPWVGGYWRDGEAGLNAAGYGIEAAEIVIETVKPYADIVGFAGPDSNTAQSGEDTANDRIEFLVETVASVIPNIDKISEKAKLAQSEIDKINVGHYPEEFRGMKVRSKLREVIDLSNEATNYVSQSKKLLEATPYLIGADDTRTYLLIFQNDKELRPTGGFITAYSIVNVSDGKFEPVISSDIYNLDNNYTPSIKSPDIFADYLQGIYVANPKFRLRDMNWSPDFRDSMETFLAEAKKAGIQDIDGVIGVDTQVVVNILDVIGQIGVPGFGNFSSENDPKCDCPQVVYELESFADVEGPVVWSENEPGKIVFAPENYDNRKKIVGPLMNSILSNALGQPMEKLPGLFEAAWKSVTEKHVAFYLFDENAQAGVEEFGIAGRIEDYDGDYLHVNDANLGGRKSNLYVTQEVDQQVDIAKDGTVTKTLTLSYKNPQSYDGWLNSVMPNWARVYVPKGSELISVEGFEDQGETYEDLGKTVFSGGFKLRPEGAAKITIKYKLPFKVDDQYKLFVQKQLGKDKPLYTITVGKQREDLFLKTDKEFKFSI